MRKAWCKNKLNSDISIWAWINALHIIGNFELNLVRIRSIWISHPLEDVGLNISTDYLVWILGLGLVLPYLSLNEPYVSPMLSSYSNNLTFAMRLLNENFRTFEFVEINTHKFNMCLSWKNDQNFRCKIHIRTLEFYSSCKFNWGRYVVKRKKKVWSIKKKSNLVIMRIEEEPTWHSHNFQAQPQQNICLIKKEGSKRQLEPLIF